MLRSRRYVSRSRNHFLWIAVFDRNLNFGYIDRRAAWAGDINGYVNVR